MLRTFYVGTSLFAPAVALTAMTNAKLLLTILGTGALTTFYTAMGGLKGVVWTDVIQLTIMLIGMVMILVVGLVSVGGPVTLWQTAFMDGKIDQISFSANPFIRYTFWSLTVGAIGAYMTPQASNQAQIQRYLSCKSLKTAKKAILLNIPIYVIFTILHVAVGLIVYVYFRGCDPRMSGQLERYDMLLSFFIMRILANIPALRGLFLSVIFAAAFSTISSGLNSLAAVGIQDVFLPIYKNRSPDREIRPERLALLSRLLGFVVSVVGTMWVSIGGIFRNTIADIPGRPPSTDACPTPDTTTLAPNLTTLASASQPKPVDTDFSFYDLSFLWLTAFAMLIGFVVAVIASLLSGMNTKKPIRQSLLASQAVSLYNRFPNCHPIQSYDDSEMQGEIESGTWTSKMRRDKSIDKQSYLYDNTSSITL
ncbi:hypothetical protein SprV_0501809100 [Sparganum proliferum]